MTKIDYYTKYFIFITILLLLVSCTQDEWFRSVTMQDGNTVLVHQQKHFYETESKFVHNVFFSWEHKFDITDVEQINYKVDSRYTVKGHNAFYFHHWEETQFGEWIEKYGLKANKTYYVATKVYAKFISMPPDSITISPKIGDSFLGYIPGAEASRFLLNYYKKENCCVMTTGIRYIGYDSEKNKIDIEIPLNTDSNHNRIWKFLTEYNIWMYDYK